MVSTMQMQDLEALKDIPGYTAILRAVLKSLIQSLVEQLSERTGEESMVLTASVSDGTLCHLGSHSGKDFLDGRDEIKSQFLRHCITRHHWKPTTESSENPNVHKKRRDTYEDSIGRSPAESSPGIIYTMTESSSRDWDDQSAIPKKRSKKKHSSFDSPMMEQTWVRNSSSVDYQSRNQSESTIKLHETLDHSAEYGSKLTVTSAADIEMPGPSLSGRRSSSLNLSVQTGSSCSDQGQSEEHPESETQSEPVFFVKQEPVDSDVAVTKAEPVSVQKQDFSESWAPGFSELQGYSAMKQGDNGVAGDSPLPFANPARGESKGDNSGVKLLQNDPPHVVVALSTDYYRLTPLKNFPCETCGKNFTRKGDLNRHKTIHSGERFGCFYCPKSFSQKYHRNVHADHQCSKRPTNLSLPAQD